MKSPFVAVVGAGQVGATTAQRLVEKNVCHVALVDVVEGLAEGKALDLMQAAPLEKHFKEVTGSSLYDAVAGASVVVITAGLARKPGMSREDLLSANARIIRTICEPLKRIAPAAVVITVTNPLDIMTQYVYELTGFPHERVIGMAGVLDSARMSYFIARKTGAFPHEVQAVVLGGHGDLMVPVMSQVRVQGQPLTGLKPAEIQEIIQKTQQGGAEIVSLLKTGSAFYAPASSIAEMVTAILYDRQIVLPACAYCTGQYGIQGVYCGVPVRLGKKGVVSIEEIPLTDQERRALRGSAEKVKKGVEELKNLTAV